MLPAYFYRIASAFGVLLAALVIMIQPAHSQTTTVVTGDDAWVAAAPVVSMIAQAVIGLAIAWASAWASRKWGIDIEAKHREALHSAARTGVDRLLAKAAPAVGGLSVDVKSQIAADGVKWVLRSVPDAVKYFKLEDKVDVIEQIVLAKLGEARRPELTVTPIAGQYAGPSPHR